MKKILPVVVLVVLLGAVGTYYYSGCYPGDSPPENSIFVIMPYKVKSSWRFDDARAGLVGEPFVAGIPEMIEMLVADIPDAENGFQLFFSTKPFPDYSAKLVWQRGSEEGNWYYCEEFQSEGWLCPALFKYYREAPREIYVKAEAK